MARTQITLTALRLHEQKSARRRVRLRGRERISEALLAATFLVIAVPMALFADAERHLQVGLAVAMVLAYALSRRPGSRAARSWPCPRRSSSCRCCCCSRRPWSRCSSPWL